MVKPIFIVLAPAMINMEQLHRLSKDINEVFGDDYLTAVLTNMESHEWDFKCFNPEEMPEKKFNEIVDLINKISDDCKIQKVKP